MSRRTILIACVIVSIVVHAMLFLLAPDIAILSGERRAEAVINAYRVRLADPAPVQLEPRRIESYSAGLVTKPETVADLLQRETVELEPLEELLVERVEVPMLRDRVAAESLERLRELTPDADMIAKLDSDIIEISQDRARDSVNVERRFVAPSPGRTLAPDEFPTIREMGAGTLGERIEFVPYTIERPDPFMAEPDESKAPPREAGALAAVRSADMSASNVAELSMEQLSFRREILGGPEDSSATRYESIDQLVDLELDAYVPPGERRGFFRLRIVPKAEEALEPLPKDVTFVIDASGSILQRKLQQSANAVQQAIRGLRPVDHFNVVVFRESASEFQPERVPASDEMKQQAIQYIEGLEAFGQTNVYEALRREVLRPPRPGVPGIVVLISDGKPTKGLIDGRDIINALTDENKHRNSIYAVAAGGSVNRYLLDLLAYRNRGESQIIDNIAEINPKFPQFFTRFDEPILVQCDVDYGNLDSEGVYPRDIPDFYRGQVVTVYGQFDPTAHDEFAVRLTGRAGPDEKEVIFRANLSDAQTGDATIARTWAHRKIYHLIGEICRVGETPELKAELNALSDKYNIDTIYSD
jgi:hypothetical protein